jgi:hypothetical protein
MQTAKKWLKALLAQGVQRAKLGQQAQRVQQGALEAVKVFKVFKVQRATRVPQVRKEIPVLQVRMPEFRVTPLAIVLSKEE